MISFTPPPGPSLARPSPSSCLSETVAVVPTKTTYQQQVSTSSQQQARDTPLPGTEDKSHSRSISSQTTTTTGTSPASSATSGYRVDGPQPLPLVLETVERSGSPPNRRGSATSSLGSGCAAASSLRPAGRRRKDSIVRAVQFAPQEELAPGLRVSGAGGGGGGQHRCFAAPPSPISTAAKPSPPPPPTPRSNGTVCR